MKLIIQTKTVKLVKYKLKGVNQDESMDNKGGKGPNILEPSKFKPVLNYEECEFSS